MILIIGLHYGAYYHEAIECVVNPKVPFRSALSQICVMVLNDCFMPTLLIHAHPWPLPQAGGELLARLAVLVDEDIAAADMVGGGNDAFFFHPFDKARGAVIADTQLALEPAR